MDEFIIPLLIIAFVIICQYLMYGTPPNYLGKARGNKILVSVTCLIIVIGTVAILSLK